MTSGQLKAAIVACFLATNGAHPMTAEDDAYATEWYTPLEGLATSAGVNPDELRLQMLAKRLPLPSYIRSDGAQMVSHDLLELPTRAGGFDQLLDYFAAQFESAVDAVSEWDAYLSGQYVCLRSVTPENIKRKAELVGKITAELEDPRPDTSVWRDRLLALVDELDKLEPPFAPYDRLRFGGPVSRDALIDGVRDRFAPARA